MAQVVQSDHWILQFIDWPINMYSNRPNEYIFRSRDTCLSLWLMFFHPHNYPGMWYMQKQSFWNIRLRHSSKKGFPNGSSKHVARRILPRISDCYVGEIPYSIWTHWTLTPNSGWYYIPAGYDVWFWTENESFLIFHVVDITHNNSVIHHLIWSEKLR